jgi:hypothetical protein
MQHATLAGTEMGSFNDINMFFKKTKSNDSSVHKKLFELRKLQVLYSQNIIDLHPK